MKRIIACLSFSLLLLTSCVYSESSFERFMEQVKFNEERENQPSYTLCTETMVTKVFELRSSDRAYEAQLISIYASNGIYVGGIQTDESPVSDYDRISFAYIPGMGSTISNDKYYVASDGKTKMTFCAGSRFGFGDSKTFHSVTFDEYNYMNTVSLEETMSQIIRTPNTDEATIEMKIVSVVTYSYS